MAEHHSVHTKSTLAYIDSVFKTKKYAEAVVFIDSVFFPIKNRTVKDKYYYYDYKRQLVSLDSQKKDDIAQSELVYIDSMISLIEGADLTTKMAKEYAAVYKEKIAVCMNWKLFDEAAASVGKSIYLSLVAKDTCETAESNRQLAFILYKQGKYINAIETYKKALALENFCNDDAKKYFRVQRSLGDIGIAFAKLKQFDSAVVYFRECEKYLNDNKYLSSDTIFYNEALLNLYSSLGQTYRNTKYLDSSIYYNEKSSEIADRVFNDTVTVSVIKVMLADSYYKLKSYKTALQYLIESEQNLKDFNISDLHLWSRVGKDVSLAQNSLSKYSVYAEKYIKYTDSIRKTELELQKRNPQAEYERVEKKFQVELLEKDVKIKEQQSKSLLKIGGLLFLLTATLLFNLFRIRSLVKKLKITMNQNEILAKQKSEEQLYFQEVRLQLVHNEDVMTQRKKISEDLHDDLSGSLVALGYYIEDLKQSSTSNEEIAKLGTIREELKSIYENTRLYMHNLRHSATTPQFNLVKLLDDMAEKFNKLTSLKFMVAVDKKSITSLLTIQQHDQLYYIINEAISNIIKHAKAKTLVVKIYFKNEKCFFEVIDDGIGFTESREAKNGGLGISNMLHRIKSVNGFIEFNSNHPSGTILYGELPI